MIKKLRKTLFREVLSRFSLLVTPNFEKTVFSSFFFLHNTASFFSENPLKEIETDQI